MTIRFPLPDRILLPNAVAHWAPLARAKKKARELARREAFKLIRDLEGTPIITGHRVYAYFRTRRFWDEGSVTASIKAHLDGIADAFRQDDVTFQCLGVTRTKDTKDPHLIIELELEYLT